MKKTGIGFVICLAIYLGIFWKPESPNKKNHINSDHIGQKERPKFKKNSTHRRLNKKALRKKIKRYKNTETIPLSFFEEIYSLNSEPEKTGSANFRVRNSDGTVPERALIISPNCSMPPIVLKKTSPVVRIALPTECMLQAKRKDKSLWTFSEAVALLSEKDQEIELILPVEAAGGLGISHISHEKGYQIVRVFPETPADRMGLQPGQVIVEVDGQPTKELSQNEFMSWMSGPDGTSVEFTLMDHDGEENSLTLERQAF